MYRPGPLPPTHPRFDEPMTGRGPEIRIALKMSMFCCKIVFLFVVVPLFWLDGWQVGYRFAALWVLTSSKCGKYLGICCFSQCIASVCWRVIVRLIVESALLKKAFVQGSLARAESINAIRAVRAQGSSEMVRTGPWSWSAQGRHACVGFWFHGFGFFSIMIFICEGAPHPA